MKITLSAKLAFLLLASTTISGCLLVPLDEGRHRGTYQERPHGEHRGERHEDNYRR